VCDTVCVRVTVCECSAYSILQYNTFVVYYQRREGRRRDRRRGEREVQQLHSNVSSVDAFCLPAIFK